MGGDDVHVSVRDARKVYRTRGGEIEAIRSVSLEVRRGEFLSILGPSGCGKSTLLMAVGGLLPLSSGRIEVDRAAVVAPRREIGIVFQTPVLLPWRTLLANVMFPAEILGLDRRAARERALQLLDRLGLGPFAHNLPAELSGGMRQRAAICRALIHEPELLLMDEPFSALDALTRDDLNQELLTVWDASRKTVLFVTHSIREAVFLSDRVVVMSGRPAVIKADVSIDLPRPRELAMQEGEQFNRYVRALRLAIDRASGSGGGTATSAPGPTRPEGGDA